jgi:hypothetical protein
MGANLRADAADLKLRVRFPVDSEAIGMGATAGLGVLKTFLRMLIGRYRRLTSL